MPSTATITAYYTMTANTKARASQANTNWSNHRGHNIPINADTATASDLTHDLGSSDHRWRTSYIQDINLRTSTTTAALLFAGDTTYTTGAYSFKINGVESFRIRPDGFVANNATPMGPTTTAAVGHLCRSGVNNASGTTSGALLIGVTLTISTNGRPVWVGFVAATATSYFQGTENNLAVAGNRVDFTVNIYRSNSLTNQVGSYRAGFDSQLSAGAASFRLPASAVSVIDFPGTGTHYYIASIQPAITSTSYDLVAQSVQLMAYEL